MVDRFVLETLDNLKSRLEILSNTLVKNPSSHKPQVDFLMAIEPLLLADKKLTNDEKRQIIYGLRLSMVKDIDAKKGVLESVGTTHHYLLESLGIDYKKKKSPTEQEISLYLNKAATFVTNLAMVKEASLTSDKKFKESLISNNNYQEYWKRILSTSLEAKITALDTVLPFDKERKVNALAYNMASSINKKRDFSHLKQVYKIIETNYRQEKKLNVTDATRAMQLKAMTRFIDILATHDLNSTDVSPSKQSQATPVKASSADDLIKAEIAIGFLLIIEAGITKGKLKDFINTELAKMPNTETSIALTPEEKAHYIRQARTYLIRRSQSNVMTNGNEVFERQWNPKEKQILSDVESFDIKAFINTAYNAFFREMCLVIEAHQAQFKKPEVKDAKGSSWVSGFSVFSGSKAEAPVVIVPELATENGTQP